MVFNMVLNMVSIWFLYGLMCPTRSPQGAGGWLRDGQFGGVEVLIFSKMMEEKKTLRFLLNFHSN